MKRMSLSLGEYYSSSFPQVAVSFGTGAHAQRMLSVDQRPAAIVPPPLARWVRGVPRTEIELFQFHKCTLD